MYHIFICMLLFKAILFRYIFTIPSCFMTLPSLQKSFAPYTKIPLKLLIYVQAAVLCSPMEIKINFVQVKKWTQRVLVMYLYSCTLKYLIDKIYKYVCIITVKHLNKIES